MARAQVETCWDEARVRLVEQHLWLVEAVVSQLCARWPRFVDRSEMLAAGRLGLAEAACGFDATVGVPFVRYARRRVHGAVLDAARAVDWAPRSVRARARRLAATNVEMASDLRRSPSSDELATRAGIDVEGLRQLQADLDRAALLSLDRGYEDDEQADDPVTLADFVADPGALGADERLEDQELKGFLRDALELLPARERIVMIAYFFEGRSSAEVAELLGVTESRISQIRTAALGTLRTVLEAQFTPPPPPQGIKARRQAALADRVGRRSDWRERLAAGGAPLAMRSH